MTSIGEKSPTDSGRKIMEGNGAKGRNRGIEELGVRAGEARKGATSRENETAR